MPDEHVSPEALAALIDGTLGKDERAKVLAAIARSEDSYDDLTESAAILAELRSSNVVTPKPIAARFPRRVYSIGISAIAAAAIAMVVISKREPSGSVSIGTLASAVAATGQGQSIRVAIWPAVRGTEGRVGDRTGAFRLGGYLADLELAARSGDTTATREILGEAREVANGLAMGGPAAYTVDQLAANTSEAERHTLEEKLRRMSGSETWFDLGAWLTIAVHGTRGQNEAFFSSDGRSSLRTLISAAERAPGQATAGQAEMLARLKRLLDDQASQPVQLPIVAAQLDSALKEAGR